MNDLAYEKISDFFSDIMLISYDNISYNIICVFSLMQVSSGRSVLSVRDRSSPIQSMVCQLDKIWP